MALKCKIEGNENARFHLIISIQTTTGKFTPAVKFCTDSSDEALIELTELVEVRYKLTRHGAANSSKYLFGGGFRLYSKKWLACHTMQVEIIDRDEDRAFAQNVFCHPYISKLNNIAQSYQK